MTEEANFCVPVGRVWRILANDASFVIQRKAGERWVSRYYTDDFRNAVDIIFRASVRTSGAHGVEELAARVEEIREEIRRDLAPLFAPPMDPPS